MSVIVKPSVEISEEILRATKTNTEEMGQVVLHFSTTQPVQDEFMIRIWPTTYLYDQHSSHISEIVHIENITYYPVWSYCPPGSSASFTLIFSGLPRSCTTFDFIEHCTNQAGAFEVRNIARNDQDVYHLDLN